MTTSPKKRLVALACCAGFLTLLAHSAEFIIDRDRVEIAAPPAATANFMVRLTEVGEIVKAEGTVGGKSAKATVSSLPQGRTAVYFLLDISEQKGEEVTSAGKEAIREAAEVLPANEFDVGLGTIGSNFTHWFYAIPEKVARNASLKGVATGKADPTAEIYRCALDGLEKLKTLQGAERKVLVLLSTGKSDDKDPRNSPEGLIAEAGKEGILVFAIGYSRTESDKARWQGLRRVAKETGGAFLENDPSTKRPRQDLVVQLRAMLKSAARVSVELKDAPTGSQEMLLQLGLHDGRKLQVQRKIDVPGAPAPGGTTPPQPGLTDPDPAAQSEPASIAKKAPKWVLPTAIGGGVLCLGLLAFVIFKMIRPTLPPAHSLNPAFTGPWPDPPLPGADSLGVATAPEDSGLGRDLGDVETQPVLGWLEEVDKSGVRGTRHPIAKGKMIIGRSSDSDLRFIDESVSVHHVTIHRRSDQSLVITDLQASNRTYINGKPVEHSVLKDGDLIELGNVRLRVSLHPDRTEPTK